MTHSPMTPHLKECEWGVTKQKGCIQGRDGRDEKRKSNANLFSRYHDGVKNVPVRLVGEATSRTGFLIVAEAIAEKLGTKVEGIAKGFVNAL